jgi:hypothetical protein
VINQRSEFRELFAQLRVLSHVTIWVLLRAVSMIR